ncbi:MAG: ubiquinol-cytochrome c reductase iron-sulfur subunit [Enterobacterales bacterium]|jgi:ubiquinol-cytochrome c reductase iron-sulfur subunit
MLGRLMTRKQLVQSTWLLVGIAVLGIGYMLFSFMGPTERVIAQNEHIVKLSILKMGQPVKVVTERGPIFFLQPNKEQLDYLKKLNKHVWDIEYSGYSENLNLFVYSGISTRYGCEVQHFPKGESPLIKYSDKARWYGGYFDPCHGSSFDYAGRAIKTWGFTHNGYELETPNLKPIRYKPFEKRLIIEF